MKRIRRILFWTHLSAGLVAGFVILVMSFTGAVLALKPQILNFVDREVRFVVPHDSPRRDVRELLAAVEERYPGSAPSAIAVDRDPSAAVAVTVGAQGTVYLDPYSGAILGTGSATANRFFQLVTNWHRYMGAGGESRALGKSVTGVSNVAFLLLALSGLYIWWPKTLTVRHLRPIVWFRRNASGRARDFNWHNTIGFWCLPAIVVMTISGAVISYPWASNLVYRLSGSPVPAPRAVASAPAATPRPAAAARPAAAVIPAGFNQLWARAGDQVPTWSLISARLGTRADAPITFTITDGAHWNKFARSTLTLGPAAEIVQWQPYEGGSTGQKVRGWLRFAHTGELAGLPGQIVAGLGCLGGVFLVGTGVSLAFRRLWNWSLWTRFHPGRVSDRVAGHTPDVSPGMALRQKTLEPRRRAEA